jgi:Fe-S-cluster containining protein
VSGGAFDAGDGGGESPADTADVVAQWFAAIERPEVADALRGLHALIAAEVALRKPICLASGQCCNFDRYDHRLFVTGLDVAWCVRSLRARQGPPATAESVALAKARGDCPFLLDGRLCGAHLERPLGCRIFFCDRTARDWQEDLYARTHKALAEVHERFAIPYRYGEWRAMLAMVCGR